MTSLRAFSLIRSLKICNNKSNLNNMEHNKGLSLYNWTVHTWQWATSCLRSGQVGYLHILTSKYRIFKTFKKALLKDKLQKGCF